MGEGEGLVEVHGLGIALGLLGEGVDEVAGLGFERF